MGITKIEKVVIGILAVAIVCLCISVRSCNNRVDRYLDLTSGYTVNIEGDK